MPFTSRHVIAAIAVTAVVLLLAVLGSPAAKDEAYLRLFGQIDFVQYWSAGKLLIAGGNPYNPGEMEGLQRTVIEDFPLPVLLWNPPLIFPFILPFSFLSFREAAVLWSLTMLILMVSALHILKGDTTARFSRRLGSYLVLATMPAALSCLAYGQCSPIAVLGLAGFVALQGRGDQRAGRFLSGLCLSVTLLKPHLLYLLYAALWVTRKLGRREILGIGTGLGLGLLVPWLLSPGIFGQYLEAYQNAPIYWKTPTLGSFLQGLFPESPPLTRFVPSAVTLLVVVPLSLFSGIGRSMSPKEQVILLVPLSLLTSPYGWVYDQLLLLPSLLALVASYGTGAAVFLAAVNLIGSLPLLGEGQESLVWYPFLIFLLTLAHLKRLASPVP